MPPRRSPPLSPSFGLAVLIAVAVSNAAIALGIVDEHVDGTNHGTDERDSHAHELYSWEGETCCPADDDITVEYTDSNEIKAESSLNGGHGGSSSSSHLSSNGQTRSEGRPPVCTCDPEGLEAASLANATLHMQALSTAAISALAYAKGVSATFRFVDLEGDAEGYDELLTLLEDMKVARENAMETAARASAKARYYLGRSEQQRRDRTTQ